MVVSMIKNLNAPIESVIEALRQLKGYCEKGKYSQPFSKLEFHEIFYFVHTHKNKEKIPLGLVDFIIKYALDYEAEIGMELMEENGIYDRGTKNIFIAKELLFLAEFYNKYGSLNPKYWGCVTLYIQETFPEIENITINS